MNVLMLTIIFGNFDTHSVINRFRRKGTNGMEMNTKRILFTGGGTAGHVIVNLALIPIFQEKGWEIDYIGSKSGIEVNLVGQVPGVTYYPIATGKLRRYFSWENI